MAGKFLEAPNGNRSSTRLIAVLTLVIYAILSLAIIYVAAYKKIENYDKLIGLTVPLISGFVPLAVSKIKGS